MSKGMPAEEALLLIIAMFLAGLKENANELLTKYLEEREASLR